MDGRRRRFVFLGVSTGSSAIHRVFRGWADCIGLPIDLEARDLRLRSPSEVYRTFVADFRLREHELAGALITSHKAALFEHARDCVDVVSPVAERLGEIGVLYWRDHRLHGDANDALSTRQVAAGLLSGRSAWLEGSQSAIILGAGGAGLALADALATTPALACKRIVLTETDAERASAVRRRVAAWQASIPIRVLEGEDSAVEALSTAGPGSLIVNATGLGKDRPGSPVDRPDRFPHRACIWDFNYRFVGPGPTYLDLARAVEQQRELTIADGWTYFVWGWLVAMSCVGNVNPSDHIDCFEKVATAVRLAAETE